MHALLGKLWYSHRLSVFVWTAEYDLNALHVNAYFFFFLTENKVPVFKIIQIRVDVERALANLG